MVAPKALTLWTTPLSKPYSKGSSKKHGTGLQETRRAVRLSSQVGLKLCSFSVQTCTLTQLHAPGKVVIDEEEYAVNDEFQQLVLSLADEAEINEIDAMRCLLDSEDDPIAIARPLLECALIRVHQQRRYTLDSIRLMFEIDALDDDEIDPEILNGVQMYLSATVFQSLPGETASSQKRLIPKCMSAIQDVRTWLQKIADKLTAAAVLINGRGGQVPEEMETIEFSRVSLYQQHELLSMILCRAIEKRDAEVGDFKAFLQLLSNVDKYDILLGTYDECFERTTSANVG